MAEHRWLGYEPVVGDDFIAVCSCGWRSPPQRTAGLAGALLDAHREEARACAPQGADEDTGDSRPGRGESSANGNGTPRRP